MVCCCLPTTIGTAEIFWRHRRRTYEGNSRGARIRSGGMFQTDSKTSLMAMVMLKPEKKMGFFGEKVASSVDSGTFSNSLPVAASATPATETLAEAKIIMSAVVLDRGALL